MLDGELGPEFREPDGIRVIERVGIGRRSLWYQAEQTRLDRVVALKCLRPFLAESGQFAEAFFEAGRQAATIVHPAALPIINVFPRQYCIAVHWCGGISLKELREPLDALKAVNIAVVAMDCLSALHATDRSHGNLAPGNIFLDESGGVWLDDFFQPPVMNDGERMFRGEHRYIAPEVLSSGATDWRSDVFSLGCTITECLAGTKCSRELVELLEFMRALDPGRRGESPAAVLSALRRVRRIEFSRQGVDTSVNRRKRMYRRVPGEFDVSLRRRSASPGETAVILNRIRDVGESGVFVETEDEFIGIGSILELDFALKGVEGNVHAFGVVRWRSSPPMPKGVGVQFLEVDQAGLARLRRFLDNK